MWPVSSSLSCWRKDPYVPPLIAQNGVQVFDAQAIPTDIGLLGVENYKAVLVERRKRTAAHLNEFLASEKTD